jgi:hypothetical protein
MTDDRSTEERGRGQSIDESAKEAGEAVEEAGKEVQDSAD